MRRTLALLALLATSWPHAVVLECALGSGLSQPGAETSQSDAHGHHGGAAAHHVGDPAGGDPDPSDAPASGEQCAMVMACGLVMMRTAGDPTEAVVPVESNRSSARTLSAPTGADVAADTPPPRPSA